MLIDFTATHIARFKDVHAWEVDRGGVPSTPLSRDDRTAILDLVAVHLVETEIDGDACFHPTRLGVRVMQAMLDERDAPSFAVTHDGQTRMCKRITDLPIARN